MLQFQSLGTLAGTLSGIVLTPSGANAPLPLQLITGVAGIPSLPSSLPLPLPLPPPWTLSLPFRLPARELRDTSQPLYSLQQNSQARLRCPRGWKEAFWSRGTRWGEWVSQKMLPQRRQWWRRVKYENVRVHDGASQTVASASGWSSYVSFTPHFDFHILQSTNLPMIPRWEISHATEWFSAPLGIHEATESPFPIIRV